MKMELTKTKKISLFEKEKSKGGLTFKVFDSLGNIKQLKKIGRFKGYGKIEQDIPLKSKKEVK